MLRWSKGGVTVAGLLAVAVAVALWATDDDVLPSAVAVGAGFAAVLTHTRWKYDSHNAPRWGWARAALVMAVVGLLTYWWLGGGLGLGLAIGSGISLAVLSHRRRPGGRSG